MNLIKMFHNIAAKARHWLVPKKIPTADIVGIFLYLTDLIVIKRGNESIREEVRNIVALKDLAPAAQEAAAEDIYVRLEKTLVQDYDMEKIRRDVRVRFNLDLFKIPFVAKFLTRDEHVFRELEKQAEAIAAKLLPAMGRSNLEKLIKNKTDKTLLNGTALTDFGLLDFSAVEFRLFRLPPPWLRLGVRFLRQLVRDLSVL